MATVVTVLSVVLAGVTVGSGVAAGSTAVVDAEPTVADPSDLFGSGQPTDPYLIATVEDLQAMSGDLSAHYALANDIDASGAAAWNGGRGFAPVGTEFDPFTGSLDGRGFTITGLTIDRPRTGYVGLFGNVYGAYVVDVHLADARVVGGWAVGTLAGAAELSVVSDATASGSVTGDTWVGGLVGVNEGSVQVLDASTSVTVRGDRDVGGLVGSSAGPNLVRDALASGPVVGEGTDSDRDDDVGGLVGSNLDGGTILNSYATGGVIGPGSRVGGLVGRNEGGSVVFESSASGDVTARGAVGGLVGVNRDSTVADSTASGAVVATNALPVSQAGGLVGRNEDGLIHRTVASGAVNAGTGKVGGLVGENRGGTVSRSGATGSVTGNDEVGGLVGLHFGGSVHRSYALGTVDGTELVGGLVGYSYLGDVSRSYAAGPVDAGATVGGLVGFNFGTVTASYWDREATGHPEGFGANASSTTDWAVGLPTASMTGDRAPSEMAAFSFPGEWRGTETYPVPAWQADGRADGRSGVPAAVVDRRGADDEPAAPTAGPRSATPPGLPGAGTPDDPYRIATAADLDAMRLAPGAHYALAGDVDAAETVEWRDGRGMASIEGPFDGSFDGAGHTISGLRVEGPGLFATLDRRGDVRDLHLEAVDVSGTRVVGGLVGRNDGGTVTRVTVTGTVRGGDFVGGVAGSNEGGTVTDSTAGATVEGRDAVGGLVGANFDGLVGNSTVESGTTVTGRERVGGLVGRADRGLVADSSAAATVEGSGDAVGGLVGRAFDATVLRSTASGSVTGFAQVGGLVGFGYRLSVVDGSVDATVEGTGVGDRHRNDGEVGGLVGRTEESVVTGSLARGSVRGVADNTGGLLGVGFASVVDSYAAADVAGEGSVGGLAGYNLAPVYASYAAGSVSGTREVGGLVGRNALADPLAYYDREAAGGPGGDGVALTTAAMTGGDPRDAMRWLDHGSDWYLTPSYPVLAREGGGPFLHVSVNHTAERVEAGETIRATSRVTNYGGAAGRGTVSLTDEGFGGLRRDAVTVDLSPGGVAHPVLEWRTGSADVGDGTMTVATPHHSTSWDVEVVAVPGGSPFDGPVPGSGGQGPPNDFDADGKYEDVDGSGVATFADAVALAFVDASRLDGDQTAALDFDDDGDVDFDDAVELAFLV